MAQGNIFFCLVLIVARNAGCNSAERLGLPDAPLVPIKGKEVNGRKGE